MIIPKKLKYQMTKECQLKISDQCCMRLKKEPVHKWEKQVGRAVAITGMRREEGGTRKLIGGCVLTDKDGQLKKFHPLLVVDDEWEEWFIKTNNVQVSPIYLPPYNFKRTGCRFCPFSLDLKHQIEVAEKLMPNEAKAGELIWKPVFDEYRRLNYRLKKTKQLSLLDEEE